MSCLSFLHHVGAQCGSSTILSSGWCFLKGIFAFLKAVPLHQYLNLVAFSQYNCCEVVVLKSTICLLVLLLDCEMQLGYLPLAPHALQYLHQDQTKMIWKISPLLPPQESHFFYQDHISNSLSLLVLSSIKTTSCIRPDTCECAIFKGLFVCLPLSLENVALICCPSMHGSLINKNMGQRILRRFMSITTFLKYNNTFT